MAAVKVALPDLEPIVATKPRRVQRRPRFGLAFVVVAAAVYFLAAFNSGGKSSVL